MDVCWTYVGRCLYPNTLRPGRMVELLQLLSSASPRAVIEVVGWQAELEAAMGAPQPTAATPSTAHNKRNRCEPSGGQGHGAAAWSVDDVVGYLRSLGLGHLEPGFTSNAVDGPMLVDLSEADLVCELGLSSLKARKIRSRLPA